MKALENADLEQWLAEGDEQSLPDVDNRGINISVPGGDGKEKDGSREFDIAYSEIIGKSAFEISILGLFGFITDYRPAHKGDRNAAMELVVLAEREMNSPVCRRKAIIAEAQKDQAKWMSRIPPEERTEEMAKARWLFSIAGKAEQIMADIKREEREEGFESIIPRAAQWFTAQERLRQVKAKASTLLGYETYMWFLSRSVELQTMRDIAADIAAGLPLRDYSDLLEKLSKGECDVTTLVAEGPIYLRDALNYCLAEQSRDNPKREHIAQMVVGVYERIENMRRRRSGYGQQRGNAQEDL